MTFGILQQTGEGTDAGAGENRRRIIMGLFGLVGAVVDLADAVVSPVIETAEEIVKDITEEIK